MDFKQLSANAGALINRALQFTEEKLGQADRTLYQPEFEALLQRADKTKFWTEKLISEMEAVLEPNPTSRFQDKFLDSVNASKPVKISPYDVLGVTLIDAGIDLGNNSEYGNTLVQCGQLQTQIASSHRSFVQFVQNSLVASLKQFLDGDVKTIEKEKSELETKRLDLDFIKNKYKRTQEKYLLEPELRNSQLHFDRQLEVVKLLLEGVQNTHAQHLRLFNEFLLQQKNYFEICLQYSDNLQKELGNNNNTAVLDNNSNNDNNYVDQSAYTHSNQSQFD